LNQQSDPNVPPSGIGNVAIDPSAEPLNQGPATELARQEQQFYRQSGEQYKLMQNQQDLGYLGKFFGANSSAPTNIAGFVIAMSVLMLFATLAMTDTPALSDGRKLLVGLISSAMAFIFGAASKK
jgi:hypothetical protein